VGAWFDAIDIALGSGMKDDDPIARCACGVLVTGDAGLVGAIMCSAC